MALALLSISHPGPVVAKRLGGGVTWTVKPADFASLIETVNRDGGPAMWRIEPADSAWAKRMIAA